jgi:hypothetical protein
MGNQLQSLPFFVMLGSYSRQRPIRSRGLQGSLIEHKINCTRSVENDNNLSTSVSADHTRISVFGQEVYK